MPPLLSRGPTDHSSRSHLALPLIALVTSILTYAGTPTQHSLLSNAIVWIAICAVCTLKTGAKSLIHITLPRKLSWASGLLLVLARVCERGFDGSGIWWAKALLPATIYVVQGAELLSNEGDTSVAPSSPGKPASEPAKGSTALLAILTASALAATYTFTVSNTSAALGLSYLAVTAFAWLLFERAQSAARHSRSNGNSVVYSANGFLAQPAVPEADGRDSAVALIRDLASAAAAASLLAAISTENLGIDSTAVWTFPGHSIVSGTAGPGFLSFFYILGSILVRVFMYGAILILIQRRGAFSTGLVPLFSAVCAQVITDPSISRLWFTGLSIASVYLFLSEFETAKARTMEKATRGLTFVTVCSYVVLVVLHFQQASSFNPATGLQPALPGNPSKIAPPAASMEPLQFQNSQVHPAEQLIHDANTGWHNTLASQSQDLGAAVAEYKRRYRIPPPPHFDKWFELAKRKNVQLIDEYDTIYHALLPFWGLPPATIRARVREALGFGPNNLIGLHIREGKAASVEGGEEWQRDATVGMMQQFIEWLPDMDLAFNIHDEPRVVVPHDELSKLVRIATDEALPEALASSSNNAFSPRPKDVNGGKRVDEVKTTRFNVFAHQPTWIPSRLSCSPDSPARALDDITSNDNLTAYALGELAFVYNHTAFSDVCNSPSFSTSHGFFDRPNAFNVVHELFPIFSQSKMSSFQDILYPSPWYWFGKVSYDGGKDMKWDQKESKLWWRGSTTGGFSRDGGWRRQHRQQFVRRMNAIDQAKILENTASNTPDAKPDWKTTEVSRQEYKDIMDVHFSHVGQCDPGDCDAQHEFFEVVEPADQQEAWKYKYLLDIDGNAFSGRFYAFLKSHSLTFKMAVFREWHEDWIKPWVHYIPLSLRGEEGLEAVRYFAAETEGERRGVEMAEAGREWASKALRNEDFEVWFFRLLLEYGRVVDDNRANIGFSGS